MTPDELPVFAAAEWGGTDWRAGSGMTDDSLAVFERLAAVIRYRDACAHREECYHRPPEPQ